MPTVRYYFIASISAHVFSPNYNMAASICHHSILWLTDDPGLQRVGHSSGCHQEGVVSYSIWRNSNATDTPGKTRHVAGGQRQRNWSCSFRCLYYCDIYSFLNLHMSDMSKREIIWEWMHPRFKAKIKPTVLCYTVCHTVSVVDLQCKCSGFNKPTVFSQVDLNELNICKTRMQNTHTKHCAMNILDSEKILKMVEFLWVLCASVIRTRVDNRGLITSRCVSPVSVFNVF